MNRALFLVAALLSLSATCPPQPPPTRIADCLRTKKDCGRVDFHHPRAKTAYQTGCDAKDYFACTRLGQYVRVKEKNPRGAVAYLERACTGGERSGCLGVYDVTMDLCYIQGEEEF